MPALSRFRALPLPVATLLMLALAAAGAYLEPGEEGARVIRPPRIPPRPPVVYPRPDHELSRWLDGAEVMAPIGKGALRVYPVRTRRMASHRYLTLDEGVRRGLVEVSETLRGGTVNRLRVDNRSGRVLVLIAGEILAGGKQDRTVDADLLLPPHSGPVPVGVFCVEQRRWDGATPRLMPETFFALPRTRGSLAAGASQADVWGEVAELQDHFSIRSPTGSLGDVYGDPEVAAETEALVRGISWSGSPNGMVVFGNGRLMGADLYCDGALFAAYRDKLLKAYATQALASRPGRGSYGSSRREAERFLERIRECRLSPRTTPGIGDNTRLTGSVEGEMLRHPAREGVVRIVHVAAYPAVRRRPYPVPMEPPGLMEPRGR